MNAKKRKQTKSALWKEYNTIMQRSEKKHTHTHNSSHEEMYLRLLSKVDNTTFRLYLFVWTKYLKQEAVPPTRANFQLHAKIRQSI